LRVAHASIMPFIVNANTNVPATGSAIAVDVTPIWT